MSTPGAAPPRITSLEQAIERIYDLNVSAIGTGANRHERPHKPLLLLTILDLLATGRASPDRVAWSNGLRERFARYFALVHGLNDQDTPENPFFRLSGDKLWEALRIEDGTDRALQTTPTAGDATAERVFGRFTDGFENFVRERSARLALREAILSRYFPALRVPLRALFAEGDGATPAEQTTPSAREDASEFAGRSPAFRRKVREVYDWQCAACGLRIKLPDAELTFVDGAHLIPFSLSQNDHPTNGIALCKNHHWAMDRFLIVPTPDGCWRTSPRLEGRRSPGERALCELNDQPVLPPHDDAFRPDPVALRWRAERLYRG